jgi:hypothetical protein
VSDVFLLAVTGFGQAWPGFRPVRKFLIPLSWNIFRTYGREFSTMTELGQTGDVRITLSKDETGGGLGPSLGGRRADTRAAIKHVGPLSARALAGPRSSVRNRCVHSGF